MKTVVRRLGRLEDWFGSAGIRRQGFRIVVRRMDRGPSSNATCRRMIWPDGSLFEVVRLDKTGKDRVDFSEEELENWIENFPVEAV